MPRPINDPMEKIIETALLRAHIPYEVTEPCQGKPDLDFYLPDFDVYIEVKQFHSDRISKQMAQVDNIIVIQGRKGAEAFALMLQRAEVFGKLLAKREK